jgi:hypothetical protein
MGSYKEPARKQVQMVQWVPKVTTRGNSYVRKVLKDSPSAHSSAPSSPTKRTNANMPNNGNTPSTSQQLSGMFDSSLNFTIDPIDFSGSHNKPDAPNDLLRNWMGVRSRYLDILLEAEAPQEGRACSQCQVGDGSWRCLDCAFRPTFCIGCCRTSHHAMPFHRVERWTGSHFASAWLTEVGLCLYLGHNGQRCHSLQHVSLVSFLLSTEGHSTHPFDRTRIRSHLQYLMMTLKTIPKIQSSQQSMPPLPMHSRRPEP